jgi:hypothetical protein
MVCAADLWGLLVQALRQVRSGQNTTFANPAYNCYLTPAGFSQVEPKVTYEGENKRIAYIAGVTDKPSRGPRDTGYAPGKDVVMCWKVRAPLTQ